MKEKNTLRLKSSVTAPYNSFSNIARCNGRHHSLTLFMTLLQDWSVHIPEKREKGLTSGWLRLELLLDLRSGVSPFSRTPLALGLACSQVSPSMMMHARESSPSSLHRAKKTVEICTRTILCSYSSCTQLENLCDHGMRRSTLT